MVPAGPNSAAMVTKLYYDDSCLKINRRLLLHAVMYQVEQEYNFLCSYYATFTGAVPVFSVHKARSCTFRVMPIQNKILQEIIQLLNSRYCIWPPTTPKKRVKAHMITESKFSYITSWPGMGSDAGQCHQIYGDTWAIVSQKIARSTAPYLNFKRLKLDLAYIDRLLSVRSQKVMLLKDVIRQCLGEGEAIKTNNNITNLNP